MRWYSPPGGCRPGGGGSVLGGAMGEPARFEAAGVADLTLRGLDQESAVSVLSSRAQRGMVSVRDRLLAEAAGNPLALLELPESLSEDQLAGLVPLPDAI